MEGLATGRVADKVVAVYFFIADGTVEVQMVAFNGVDESRVALHFYGLLRLRFAYAYGIASLIASTNLCKKQFNFFFKYKNANCLLFTE